jgi:hypothetical protein
VIINGVAVVTAPAEIGAIAAGQVRMVLLDAGSHKHMTVVADVTRTWLCDPAGHSVLVRAHASPHPAGQERPRDEHGSG